jgi:cell division protein FtsB
MSVLSSALSAGTNALSPYLLAIKVGIIVIVATSLVYLVHHDRALTQQIGADKVAIAQAKSDNDSNLVTINQLKAANAAFAATQQDLQQKIATLNQAVADGNVALQTARTNLKQKQSHDITPQSQSLLGSDLCAVAPDVCQRLRLEAGGIDPH